MLDSRDRPGNEGGAAHTPLILALVAGIQDQECGFATWLHWILGTAPKDDGNEGRGLTVAHLYSYVPPPSILKGRITAARRQFGGGPSDHGVWVGGFVPHAIILGRSPLGHPRASLPRHPWAFPTAVILGRSPRYHPRAFPTLSSSGFPPSSSLATEPRIQN